MVNMEVRELGHQEPVHKCRGQPGREEGRQAGSRLGGLLGPCHADDEPRLSHPCKTCRANRTQSSAQDSATQAAG